MDVMTALSLSIISELTNLRSLLCASSVFTAPCDVINAHAFFNAEILLLQH